MPFLNRLFLQLFSAILFADTIFVAIEGVISLNTITKKLKLLIIKYAHAWIFLYGIIYITWFGWLEDTVTSHFTLIYSPLDSYIPFLEIFIIPYLLWFFYVAVTWLYFFFTDRRDFYKFSGLCIIGMTLFLIICTLFPNGLRLRPTVFPRDNIFVDLVRMLYSTDTPTNVLPSLHVYNSLACHIAIMHSKKLSAKKWVTKGSLVLCSSIVMSTVFLKQHSVIDVLAAFIIIYFGYIAIYAPEKARQTAFAEQHI